MSIPVVQVAVTLADPSGTRIAGAQVSAVLAAPIVYQGIVLPTIDSQVTDINGQCTLSLVPTDIGIAPTTYSIEIWPPYASEPTVFAGVAVPSTPPSVTLQELLGGQGAVTTLTYWAPDTIYDGSLYFG